MSSQIVRLCAHASACVKAREYAGSALAMSVVIVGRGLRHRFAAGCGDTGVACLRCSDGRNISALYKGGCLLITAALQPSFPLRSPARAVAGVHHQHTHDDSVGLHLVGNACAPGRLAQPCPWEMRVMRCAGTFFLWWRRRVEVALLAVALRPSMAKKPTISHRYHGHLRLKTAFGRLNKSTWA